MPRITKTNDNGPPPNSPNDDTAADQVRDVVAEVAEDVSLAQGREAKRKGLCCDYTRAPWLVKG